MRTYSYKNYINNLALPTSMADEENQMNYGLEQPILPVKVINEPKARPRKIKKKIRQPMPESKRQLQAPNSSNKSTLILVLLILLLIILIVEILLLVNIKQTLQ